MVQENRVAKGLVELMEVDGQADGSDQLAVDLDAYERGYLLNSSVTVLSERFSLSESDVFFIEYKNFCNSLINCITFQKFLKLLNSIENSSFIERLREVLSVPFKYNWFLEIVKRLSDDACTEEILVKIFVLLDTLESVANDSKTSKLLREISEQKNIKLDDILAFTVGAQVIKVSDVSNL